jgi:ribosomal protein S18 acetylase RimI-like enzyme
MQDLTIVEANLADPQHQDAIIAMVNAYAGDPMGGGGDLPAEIRTALIPGLQKHPTTLIFLAFHGAEPVGIAVCFVGFSTFAARTLINIHDLAVIPAYRRQGVGQLLLEQVAAKGRDLGCCKLTLEVREDNTPAQQLYQRMGFSQVAYAGGATRVWFIEKAL